MAILDNVYFAYVKIQSPVKKYKSEDTEFTIDCIISKEAAKAWKKLGYSKKVKTIDTDEFKESFKIDPPFPEQDEQYVLKLTKLHTKDGKELPVAFRPRVFEVDEDGKKVDITFTKLVANGSKGKVSYSTYEGKDGETFVQLQAILVEDMIEFKRDGGGGVGSDFGIDEAALTEAPVGQKPVQRQGVEDDEDEKPKKKDKKEGNKAPKPVEQDEDDEDSSPF